MRQRKMCCRCDLGNCVIKMIAFVRVACYAAPLGKLACQTAQRNMLCKRWRKRY